MDSGNIEEILMKEFLLVWPHPRHVKVPGPGMEPMPLHWILNPLHHKKTEKFFFFFVLISLLLKYFILFIKLENMEKHKRENEENP